MWITVTEPPLTTELTDAQVVAFIKTPFRSDFCCHTQPVERQIALMTRTGRQVAGEDRQSAQHITAGQFRKDNPSRKQAAKVERREGRAAKIAKMG